MATSRYFPILSLWLALSLMQSTTNNNKVYSFVPLLTPTITTTPTKRRKESTIKESTTKSPSSLDATSKITSQQQQQQQQLGTFESLNTSSSQPSSKQQKRSVVLYDYSSQSPIKYTDMWDMQKKLVDCHLHRLASSSSPWQFLTDEDCSSVKKANLDTSSSSSSLSSKNSPADVIQQVQQHQNQSLLPTHFQKDAIIMLQHTPVYTLGTASDPSFIITSTNEEEEEEEEEEKKEKVVDIIRIERGGEVTCHAPGQLVVYPILDLRGYKQDIHWYMRALEECIIVALKKVGIEGAKREENLTGVWVQNKKIAALGIKVRRWVTMHGLAINVEQSCLKYFDGIVPCGLVGRDVTCVNDCLGSSSSSSSSNDDESSDVVLHTPLSVEEFGVFMKEALEEVFEVQLVDF